MTVQRKPVEIRLFTEQDAQALWDLRMLALETDPWSFVESPEELRAISVEEFATRLRADQRRKLHCRRIRTAEPPSEWLAATRKCRSNAATKPGSGVSSSRPPHADAESPDL